MTVAVCLKCGELKHGAFNPCRRCGYAPSDDESLTKHLLVTDHYHSREALEAISERIKAGEPITFDPATLKAAWVSKAQLDAQMQQFNRGCMAVLLASSSWLSLPSLPTSGGRRHSAHRSELQLI